MLSQESQREQSYNFNPILQLQLRKTLQFMLQSKCASIPACRFGVYCHARLAAGETWQLFDKFRDLTVATLRESPN